MPTMANKNCQSCGMPLKKDEKGGGANADGTISSEYCSRCYDGGAFREPDMTVEEMQIRVKQALRRMGIPGFMAVFFTRRVPQLKRWQQK